jgi:flagellar basal-body rod protein FlgG
LDNGIYVATSGFLTQQKRLEIIANNLANASTAGYKGDLPIFRISSPSRQQSQWEGEWPLWNPIFVTVAQEATDFSQGPVVKTGNPLDVAIVGEGFFEIQTAQGLRYTRRGDFSLTRDGTLVTQEGDSVMGEGGPIVLTQGEVGIDEAGFISVDDAQQGRLRVVTFPDTESLVKEGAGRFAWAGNASEVRSLNQSDLRQGYLENSNVNPIREMVRMIEAIRTFENQQKVVHAFDGIQKSAVNEVGRLR